MNDAPQGYFIIPSISDPKRAGFAFNPEGWSLENGIMECWNNVILGKAESHPSGLPQYSNILKDYSTAKTGVYDLTVLEAKFLQLGRNIQIES